MKLWTRGTGTACALMALAGVPACADGQAFPDTTGLPASLLPLARQIAPVYAVRPDDGSVLYQLAVLEARAGRRAESLRTLERLANTRSGADPRLRDGFQSLADDPRFRAIVERIRREHPPVLSARRVFDIPEGDLFPEGVAWSATTRRLYFGSSGRILSATLDGRLTDFARGIPGLGAVLGIRIDDARGELWAASGWFAGPPPDGIVRGVYRFRLSDSSLVASYPWGTQDDYLNDIAVAPDGIAYATASASGALVRIDPSSRRVDEFLARGVLPDPNGIAISRDGRYAFVAGWYGIARVDLATRHTSVLAQPSNVASGCIDGLYLRSDREIIAVQNCIHSSGRILRLGLNAERDSIVTSSVLESYNPLFDGITTAAIVGDELYFVANMQWRKIGADGKPTAPFDPLHVLVLPLPRDGVPR